MASLISAINALYAIYLAIKALVANIKEKLYTEKLNANKATFKESNELKEKANSLRNLE
jgi:hypothetical protein